MAATETLPSTTEIPLTTASLLLLGTAATGPIDEIMESAPTHSVEVDIRNSVIQEVLPSSEIELEVIAPDRKSVERILSELVGGAGFLYELDESRHLKGLYELKVISRIGPLQVAPFARALQAISHRVSFYLEGNLVPAL